MPTSSRDSDKKLQWSYSERWGFTILGIGVLILFAVIVVWICGTKPAPESHHISMYLTPDTLSANVRDLYSTSFSKSHRLS